MSNQSYPFNPQVDRLAIAGGGFRYPCLTTTGRLGVPVSTEDAGLTIFDTTLKQLFVWTGVAWTQLKRKSFDPADFGPDYSWWAARLESYANGALVPTWTDRGSGTLTVTGAVGQEPEFRDGTDPAAPNGQPCVRWTSGDRLLSLASPQILPDWTVAVVCRPTAITGTTNIIGSSSFFASASVRYRGASGGQLVIYTGISSISPSIRPITPIGWQVIVVTIQGDQQLKFFKSGLSVAPSPDNFVQEGYVAGGAYNIPAGQFALGGNPFTGEIAEAVLWRSALSSADKITIGKQLSDLYGISY
jgi:hypothetical protein